MPELPEVEEARKRLAKAAEGKTIARVRLLHPALAKRITAGKLRGLKGRRIVKVERRGKHQLLHLDDGRTIAIHFRMNGDWEIGKVSDEEPRFTRASIELENGTRVALTDMRALSTVELFDKGEGEAARAWSRADGSRLQCGHARRLARAAERRDQAGAARPEDGGGDRKYLFVGSAVGGEDQPEGEGRIAERASARAAGAVDSRGALGCARGPVLGEARGLEVERVRSRGREVSAMRRDDQADRAGGAIDVLLSGGSEDVIAR